MCLWGCLCPGLVAAHGAFPESRAVAFQSEDSALPLVLTTFGLITPESSGTWWWICEEITGSSVITDVLVLPSGRTLVATGAGPWASDDLCTWAKVAGEVNGADVAQLSLSADGAIVWLADAGAAPHGGLWRSDDGGQTFALPWTEALGVGQQVTSFALGADGLPLLATTQVGSSNTLHQRDGGTWVSYPLDGELGDRVTVLGLSEGGVEPAWLSLSTGAGDRVATFTAAAGVQVVLEDTLGDFVTSFASGPGAGEIRVGGRVSGLFTSVDGGQTFSAPTTRPVAGCLSRRGAEFYQCTDNYLDSVSLVRHTGDASTFEPVMAFGQIRGTLSCPAGSTVQTLCEPLWPLVELYGLNQATPTPTMDGSATATPTSAEVMDEGCGCSDEGDGQPALLMLMLGALRRRRARMPDA